MKVSYEEVVKMLGEKFEAALECMWDMKGWGEEVELEVFLKEWTEYTIDAARFAERNNL